MARSNMADLFSRRFCPPFGYLPQRFQRNVVGFLTHTILNVKTPILDLTDVQKLDPMDGILKSAGRPHINAS